MRFSILIICILFLTTSCYEQDAKTYQFDWATVDTGLIDSELLKIAKTQNPYPKEVSIDRSRLNAEVNQLSSQVNSLRRMARDKCIPERILRAPKEIMPSSTNSSNSKSLSSKALIEITSRNTCIKDIESDPLISDLKIKMDKLKNISKLKSNHDSKLRESVRAYSLILISEYSKDKFEIVIKSNRSAIVYNKSGLSIDITDAILNKMKVNEPQVLIQ